MSIVQLESQIEEVPAPEVPENYLNVTHGILSWLLTKDHKRIEFMYLVSVTVMFFIGGFAIAVARLNLTHARRQLDSRRYVQPFVHAAWRDYGVFFSGSRGAGGAGQFCAADDDWRERSGVAAD